MNNDNDYVKISVIILMEASMDQYIMDKYMEEYKKNKKSSKSPYEFIKYVKNEEKKERNIKNSQREKKIKNADLYNLREICNIIEAKHFYPSFSDYQVNDIEFQNKKYSISSKYMFEKSDDNDFTYPWHREIEYLLLEISCSDGRKISINEVYDKSTSAVTVRDENGLCIWNYIEVLWNDSKINFNFYDENKNYDYDNAINTLDISRVHDSINYSPIELNYLSNYLVKFLNEKNIEMYEQYKAELDFYNSPEEVAKRLIKSLTLEQKTVLKDLLNK